MWKTSQVHYKRRYPAGQWVHSRGPISVFIREKQIKTTVYIYKNGSHTAKNEKWYGCLGILSGRFLIKLNTRLLCKPAIPVLGICAKYMISHAKKKKKKHTRKKRDLYSKVYGSFIHKKLKAENNRTMGI